MDKVTNNKREARFVGICLAATLAIFGTIFHNLATGAYQAYVIGNTRLVVETLLFSGAIFFVAYGNVLYQVCLIGFYKRREEHKNTNTDDLESIYSQKAPSLSVIIPAYKEERKVNWQTMVSAGLAEYPAKNVVLLIDDPYYATALPDRVRLEDTRKIPQELQALFDAPAEQYRAELEAFRQRRIDGKLSTAEEFLRLANHYENVAGWLDKMAVQFMGNESLEQLHFADRFFVETILYKPAKAHRERAQQLCSMVEAGASADTAYIEQQYARLVGLFTVNFSSFERKKYSNLSHEANKAMNLNSYMGVIGKALKEVPTKDGKWELIEVSKDEADFVIPHADYVNTIDSDSLMTHEYALRLIHMMEQPENHRLAVIQSPCSSLQGCPGGLERTAGACIDIQFRTHQGYTYWGGSFWVGANAMLRRTALEEIKETHIHDGNPVSVYIQDRTVIEDTESTIDLVHKGWKLYNYPERMTFSATPPDYGSLLIQRRRWSNGGLLILPKLFNYAWHAPKSMALAKEMFMRFHYLASTTTGLFSALLLMFYPFTDVFSGSLLPFSIVPFMILHIRDLRNSGYVAADALRICAMNLMLLPIVAGGVFKSIEQIITGKKIPFGRTPKVPGRTAAPALYSAIAVAMPLAYAATGMQQLMIHSHSQAVFSFINAAFLSYALVYFIGVKAAFEDMLSGVAGKLGRALHNAEIIPIPTVQPQTAQVALAVGQQA